MSTSPPTSECQPRGSGCGFTEDQPQGAPFKHGMDFPNTVTSAHPGRIDFDIHGVVRIRLIDASPDDLEAVSDLFGCPSKQPLGDPDVTVRFVEDLPVRGIRFLGHEQHGFTDEGFFLLQEGTRQVKARIPFDQIGGRCEIVCKSHHGSLPLLLPIVSLNALKRECVPVHASAIVYDGVGILMAGWAHCGKTAALLGFASKGAEYVGEEWVLLNGNSQRMYGLVRPFELSYRHVAGLPHVRNAMKLASRCAFHGIGVLNALQKMFCGDRVRGSLVFRSIRRASAAVEERLRPAVAPSAIFQDRIRTAGAPVDKIFLFFNHEDQRIEVEQIAPFDMARRLSLLVQHELTPLLGHDTAYRFAFPRRKNEVIESAAEDSFRLLARAINGKDTYIVRLPYPHAFLELYNAIQPLCERKKATTAESVEAWA